MNLNQNSFNSILQKLFLFEKSPHIAIGVSGGPDSMSLAYLLNNWIKNNNGTLIAIIIDHQIRIASGIEAKQVKKNLDKLKIKSKIIKIKKIDIKKKNMLEARLNRFREFTKFCHKNSILHLFLAHHHDDNIETFLIRKIAGSNFEGLRSIKEKIIINNIQILRPLLCFKKKALLKINKVHKIDFVSDPSNKNLKYSRVIVRNFLNNHKEHKLEIEKDFQIIKKYYPFYKKMIFQIFNKLTLIIDKKKIIINSEIFFKEDEEIQCKIIEIIYAYLLPKRSILRYKKILRIIEILHNKVNIKTNLAGMSIKKDQFLITFTN